MKRTLGPLVYRRLHVFPDDQGDVISRTWAIKKVVALHWMGTSWRYPAFDFVAISRRYSLLVGRRSMVEEIQAHSGIHPRWQINAVGFSLAGYSEEAAS